MKYTEKEKLKKVLEICREIQKPNVSLRKTIARKDMPSNDTFYNWINSSPLLMEHYTRARLIQADVRAGQALEIADNKENDFYTDKDGIQRPNAVAVQRDNLRVNTRKWLAEVEAPRKYGKSLDVTTGGEKFDVAPIVIKIDGSDIEDKMKM